MSPSDYIIQRKDAQVQKLTGEVKALRDKMREYEPDAYSAEEDEEFLNSKISEATEPIQQHLIEMNEERELQSFLAITPMQKFGRMRFEHGQKYTPICLLIVSIMRLSGKNYWNKELPMLAKPYKDHHKALSLAFNQEESPKEFLT